MLKLYLKDSNKYAGLLTQPALCELLETFSVRLNATLMAAPPKASSKTKKGAITYSTTGECSVHIIVYGLKTEKLAVSDLLSNASLFLQQPSITECEIDIEYCNPQYLVRPGAQLPALEELSISPGARVAKSSETLDGVERNRLLRIFDSMEDFDVTPQLTTSPRLRSFLKSQVIAL